MWIHTDRSMSVMINWLQQLTRGEKQREKVLIERLSRPFCCGSFSELLISLFGWRSLVYAWGQEIRNWIHSCLQVIMSWSIVSSFSTQVEGSHPVLCSTKLISNDLWLVEGNILGCRLLSLIQTEKKNCSTRGERYHCLSARFYFSFTIITLVL